MFYAIIYLGDIMDKKNENEIKNNNKYVYFILGIIVIGAIIVLLVMEFSNKNDYDEPKVIVNNKDFTYLGTQREEINLEDNYVFTEYTDYLSQKDNKQNSLILQIF